MSHTGYCAFDAYMKQDLALCRSLTKDANIRATLFEDINRIIYCLHDIHQLHFVKAILLGTILLELFSAHH